MSPYLITGAVGLVAGMLLRAFSLGGAALAKPGVRLAGVDPLPAIGTTLPAVTIATLVDVSIALRSRQLRFGLTLLISIVGGSVAFVTGLAAGDVPGDGHLNLALSGAMIVLSALRWRQAYAPAARAEGNELSRRDAVLFGSLSGAGAGAVSGLLGLGGGIVLAPTLTGRLRLSNRAAGSITCIVVAWTTSIALIAHGIAGTIDWAHAGVLAVAVFLGQGLGGSVLVGVGPVAMSRYRVALIVFGAAYMVVELSYLVAGGW